MPTDEVRRGTDAVTSRVRTGPRHAAPKKPLLTRVPVGKAIALAAMPTAVLMGMGLTPQLAQAKPGVPENPFQDGPCVTVPDEPSKDAEKAEKDAGDKAAADKAAADKAAADKAAAEKAEREAARKKQVEDARKRAEDAKKKGEEKGDVDKPSPSPSAETPERGEPSPSAGTDKRDEADTKAPESEPSKPTNPLDPLGVGDALKDLLTPDEPEKESPQSEDDKDGADDKVAQEVKGDGSRDGRATKPVEDTVDKAKDEAGNEADDKADGKADDKAKDKADDGADGKKDEADPEESKDPMAPDENGKKPFPCVVEKKVDGDDEQSPAPIPNQPWHLEASSLLLKGADYKGVVNLKMPNGETKQALKYIISGGTDIGDLHQIVDGPGGKKYHVQAAKGSMSTIRNGDTTMYTERISGNLFGLIPVTFDPEHPPPLNLPLIYFTDVKVQQAGQFGGDLTIPGLHQSITD
ncbi:hypothetical protein ACIG3E_18540 [Streptomyces sp. NPDC053474]|uniref:hypothetical protein n=1 Tax=Streptomyces sp. NPDC053474 TaxID=3365704 RepID=UPI0037D0393D